VSRHPGLCDDERVVALDPAVRGEDQEVELDCEHLAVLGDRLPVELDDVAESLGVVAPAEAEPLGADPVLVRARRASLYLLVPRASRIAVMASPGRAAIARISWGGSRICLPSCVQSSAIIRPRRSASGSFQSARYFSANLAALRDEISTKACVSVIGYLR
jgi:hypothetical protein